MIAVNLYRTYDDPQIDLGIYHPMMTQDIKLFHQMAKYRPSGCWEQPVHIFESIYWMVTNFGCHQIRPVTGGSCVQYGPTPFLGKTHGPKLVWAKGWDPQGDDKQESSTCPLSALRSLPPPIRERTLIVGELDSGHPQWMLGSGGPPISPVQFSYSPELKPIFGKTCGALRSCEGAKTCLVLFGWLPSNSLLLFTSYPGDVWMGQLKLEPFWLKWNHHGWTGAKSNSQFHGYANMCQALPDPF